MNVTLGIQVITVEPTPAVVWARRASLRSVQVTIEAGMRRVRRVVRAARVPTCGPPFVRFLSFRPRLDIEVGLPLHGPCAVPSHRPPILPGEEAAGLWHTSTLTPFGSRNGGYEPTPSRPGIRGSGTGRRRRNAGGR